MSAWRLTIRHGSEVKRKRLASLDEAIDELQRRAEAVRAEGPLAGTQMLRSYEPEVLVHARLEITGPGRIRRPEAGLDAVAWEGRTGETARLAAHGWDPDVPTTLVEECPGHFVRREAIER